MRNKKIASKWQSDNKDRRKSKKPAQFKVKSYTIESIDPLGQGVAKEGENVTFIAKTLPNETVSAQVIKKKKGVSFAVLKSVEVAAENRIEPKCEHYGVCPGCHFLHTDYDSELSYKKRALMRMLQKLRVAEDDVQVIAAEKREGYRNRIQLHYRSSNIGLIDGLRDQIVSIPNCRILREELRPTLSSLYENNAWTEQYKGEGHCELYLKGDKVSLEWNLPYAHGGFTQVYDEMNIRLCESVSQYLNKSSVTSVLDLFSGDGNLSQPFVDKHGANRTMIDLASADSHEKIHQLDLYSENAIFQFQKISAEKHFDAIIVDPPRKGFPELSDWVKQYSPEKLIYVSCNAVTMVRDLMKIGTAITIEKVELLDFFPSTYHFETVLFISLEHKKGK